MHNGKRTLSLLIALAICLSLIGSAWAKEQEAYTNDDLLELYLTQSVPETKDDGPALDGEPLEARRYLTGVNAAVYPALYKMVAEVAAGTRESTEFYIPYADVMEKTVWTAEELGVSELGSGTELTEEAQKAVNEKIGCSAYYLILTLLADCPFELYWFDIEQSWTAWSLTADEPYTDGATVQADGGYTFSLAPAEEYAGEAPFTVDTAKTGAVLSAKENAESIVEKYKDKTDTEKLEAYMTELCELNDCSDEAEESAFTYGAPQQLVLVFDGDPDTNAGSEAYARAFQYLCDLTDFENDITCCTVWGTVDGDPDDLRLWNIVRLDDGQNYLTDVMACDQGEEPSTDRFLVPAKSGSLEEGYTVASGSLYTYDDTVLDVYREEDLTLVIEESEPTTEPTTEPTSEPTQTPEPTAAPTPTPKPTDTPKPTATPTPTPKPTATPTPKPTATPTPKPTSNNNNNGNNNNGSNGPGGNNNNNNGGGAPNNSASGNLKAEMKSDGTLEVSGFSSGFSLSYIVVEGGGNTYNANVGSDITMKNGTAVISASFIKNLKDKGIEKVNLFPKDSGDNQDGMIFDVSITSVGTTGGNNNNNNNSGSNNPGGTSTPKATNGASGESGSNNSNNRSGGAQEPKTGDDNSVVIWIAALILCTAAAIVILPRKKEQ